MRHLRNRLFLLSDIVLLPWATVLAYSIRFEGASWAADPNVAIVRYVAISFPIKIAMLYAFGSYGRLWQYASVADLRLLVRTWFVSTILTTLLGAVLLPLMHVIPVHVPYSVLVLDAAFSALFIGLPRFAPRLRFGRRRDGRPAIIVGAGAAGGMIARELTENGLIGFRPVGFVDDDPRKQKMRLHDVPVLGRIEDLASVADRTGAADVIIAIPSAPGRVVRSVVRSATEHGLHTRTVPGLFELIEGKKLVAALRNIEIHDLLRREPIITDTEQVASLVTGKTVLITGAGGSIGSELCRQLARLEPSCIVALGRGENTIFTLLEELNRDFPHVRVEAVIADVREERRMQKVLSFYRPYSVFHAAAHKHVPLMEANVSEAVINNVLGTRNVVHCASMCEAEHFVLISSDKAVRPTSVMGATKRIAEYVVHDVAIDHPQYCSVRFGNVLGSRGSVVPTFMRQIAAGGPVTITHPDMTRYFMTIPEAVQLVLQASAIGDHGEIFVLDMGDPVRVLDLASDMIRLSGLELGHDIEIQILGTRPGEKLYEELFFSRSVAMPTEHAKILRAKDTFFPPNGHEMIDRLIANSLRSFPAETLRNQIAELVPEYHPPVAEPQLPRVVEELAPEATMPVAAA